MKRISLAQAISRGRRPGHAASCLVAPSRGVLVAFGALTLSTGGMAGCAAVSGVGSGHHATSSRAAQVVSVPLHSQAGTDRLSGSAAQNVAGGVDDGWFFDNPRVRPAAYAGVPGSSTTARASAPGSTSGTDLNAASSLAGSGIPSTALAAYRDAAAREAVRQPSCGLVWPLLAGIGRVESNHGRFAGAVLHLDGTSTPRIIGIPLTGNGSERITDTDGGRVDGDPVFDHAVGPMQFIPSTWASWGVDANRDGHKDPFNIKDASAAAADYLCAAGRNLRTYPGQVQAVRSYNNSDAYIAMVLQLERVYGAGVGDIHVPVLPTSPNPHRVRPPHPPKLPPVDPGTPQGLPKPRPRPTPGENPSTSRSPSSSSSRSPSASTSGSPSASTSRSPSASSSAAPTCSTSSATPSPTDTTATGSSPAPSTSTTPNGSSSSSTGGTPTGAVSTTVPTTAGSACIDSVPNPAAATSATATMNSPVHDLLAWPS